MYIHIHVLVCMCDYMCISLHVCFHVSIIYDIAAEEYPCGVTGVMDKSGGPPRCIYIYIFMYMYTYIHVYISM